MQNNSSIAIGKRIVQQRMAWQWLLVLLVLSIFGLACVSGFSKSEAFSIHPEASLPSGSLIFTNHWSVFKLDSGKSVNESVTEIFSTTVGSPVFSPSFFPGNSTIVFIWSKKLPREPIDPSASAYYPRGVYLLDTTGKHSPDLLWRAHDGSEKLDTSWPTSSQWSVDGKSIIFLLGSSSDYRDVYRLDPKTSTLELIFKCEWYCQFVVTAPISNRLLLTSFEKTDPTMSAGRILILEEDDTVRELFGGLGIDHITKPSWSPDESMIAFTMQPDRQDYRNIFVINTDGTGLSQLTQEGAYHSPVWSPDGKMLAFVEEAYANSGQIPSRIILMDLQTKSMQTLFTSPTQLDDLQWLK